MTGPRRSRAAQAAESFPHPPTADAPLSTWAKWCADVGRLTGAFKVFPCVPGEKRPLYTEWQDNAAWDREAVVAMWQRDPSANVGLAIQPGFVAIDADLYKPGREAALAAFERTHGRLPETLTSRTARGGLHLIYATRRTLGNGRGTLPDFGDVRGYGGLIVGPGSIFEGKQYSVERLAAPVALPDRIEAMLLERAVTRGDKRADYGDPIAWDREQAARLIEFAERGELVKSYAGPFREGERDTLTFQLFAEAKGRMIHPDAMLAAVLDAGIDGGLDADVVERKMQSAYHDGNTQDVYGAKVPRYWLPNYVFTPIIDGKPVHRPPADPVEWKAENADKLPERFRGDPKPEADADSAPAKPDGLYDGPEYASRPQPRWLIRDVLQEAGYGIASGRSQSGKSFCELAKALSIATGKPWLGRSVETAGPVLYVAAEGQGRIWQDVRAWCAMFEVDPASLRGRFFIYDRSARLNADAGREALAAILAYIKHVTGRAPILAVFDTLRRNMRGGVSQEEPTSDVLHAVNGLQTAGIAVTLVAHHGRGHDETKGLTEWEDDADLVAIYSGTVRDRTTTITFKKIKSASDGWSLAVEYAERELPDGGTALVAFKGSEAAPASQQASPERDNYRAHDGIAAQILDRISDPTADRAALAAAVMGELDPEGREADPTAFSKAVAAYKKHLSRLTPKHDLWRYVDGKNPKGEPLTFRNPAHGGRRAPRPGRPRGALDFAPLNEGGQDA